MWQIRCFAASHVDKADDNTKLKRKKGCPKEWTWMIAISSSEFSEHRLERPERLDSIQLIKSTFEMFKLETRGAMMNGVESA